MPIEIPEPWLSFLREVDHGLAEATEVHCLGGFVLMVLWDLPRPTGDVDFVEIAPAKASADLLRIAGAGSELEKEYRLQFHRVTVAEYPEGYAPRLIDVTPRTFRRLRLLAFEVHDLVLAKLGRNMPRDREDVAFLIDKGALDRDLLIQRFHAELRPYSLNESRLDANLKLWLAGLFPAAAG